MMWIQYRAEKYNGTTLDMREAAGIEYTSWDDLLNEVYGGPLPLSAC